MIRAFVFDICDTLVHTAGVQALLRLPGLPQGHSIESIDRWFGAEPIFYAYERGEVPSAVFLERMRQGLELATDLDTLEQAYTALVLEEIAGVPQILARLKKDFSLYALSNNNPLLWQGVVRVSPAVRLFDALFLSHEIGLLKPEPAVFDFVLRQVACRPEEVVLVDDNPACVLQAHRSGWHAILFKDAADLDRQLQELGGGTAGAAP